MCINLKHLLRFVFIVPLISFLSHGIMKVSPLYAQGGPTLTIASDIPAVPGAQVDVPIMYTGNGASIATMAFSLNYNENCLSVDPTDADENGMPDNISFNMPAGFAMGVSYDSTDTDSELDFSILQLASTLSAMPDRVLGTVTFDASADCPGTNAAVLFSSAPNASFGNTSGVSIPGTTVGGSVQIDGWMLSGNVRYQASEKVVSGATVDLTGASTGQTTTDLNGDYSFASATVGAYTVTPTLSGQVNGISSFDAAFIAQCVAGLRDLADCPLLAADSSGNSQLSSFDAALIAQFAAGLAGPTSRVGTWVFDPSERVYPNLSGSLTDQDFAAYLVGEVTGNWQPVANPSTD